MAEIEREGSVPITVGVPIWGSEVVVGMFDCLVLRSLVSVPGIRLVRVEVVVPIIRCPLEEVAVTGKDPEISGTTELLWGSQYEEKQYA